jgi:hypothetical protein
LIQTAQRTLQLHLEKIQQQISAETNIREKDAAFSDMRRRLSDNDIESFIV